MGFREIMSKLGERSKQRKEQIKDLDERVRIEQLVQDRQKSANERELEKFINEKREKQIKEQLEFARKEKEHDINFNHNPLDVPNITSHTQWNVLKEKNLFSGKQNSILNQEIIHKSNPKLLKNEKWLFK